MGYLHEYAREPLAAPRYPVDVRGGIADDAWGMLANGPDPSCTVAPEGLGDCGFAGRQHYRMAKAAAYGEAEAWETADELAAEYLAYDHGQDAGVSLPAVLGAWYQAGKILAFAPVDHTDPAAVDAAMQAFRGVYAGVDLTGDADALFQQGQPWTVANGEQADPNEGHCIVKVHADGQGADGWVTWGHFQRSTPGWSAACLTEAYVIITSEDEAAKVDMPRLLADIEALGGTGGTTKPPKGNSVFAALEAEFAKVWHVIDGEAKAAIGQAIADAKADATAAKADLAKFEPLIGEFEAEAKAVIMALEPTVKAQLLALIAKLVSGAAPLLGKEPEPPAGM
jgi:hypothetical protein